MEFPSSCEDQGRTRIVCFEVELTILDETRFSLLTTIVIRHLDRVEISSLGLSSVSLAVSFIYSSINDENPPSTSRLSLR